jgi:CheY-specific phosphatase CheX
LTVTADPTRGLIIAAIHEAATVVFSTMFNLSVVPEPATDHPQPEPVNGIVAMLGFTGPWIGSGMLFCPERTACRVGSAMLMHEIREINSDLLDGLGEMANMILGNFKESMEQHVGALSLSLPMVVYGKNFTTRAPTQAPWIIVPFQLEEDSFEVRVCMKAQP